MEIRKGRAIILHDKDNVATALEDLPKGSCLTFSEQGYSITLADDIPFGHKMALLDLPEGAHIIKYGAAIGRLTRPVKAGEHVHLHNLVTLQRKEANS